MIALHLLALLQAAATPVPQAEVTEQVVGTTAPSVVVSLPTGSSWLAMSPAARRMHAVVSVEALRINPLFRSCRTLTPIAFEAEMGTNAAADPASTTITITALTLYALCPPAE